MGERKQARGASCMPKRCAAPSPTRLDCAHGATSFDRRSTWFPTVLGPSLNININTAWPSTAYRECLSYTLHPCRLLTKPPDILTPIAWPIPTKHSTPSRSPSRESAHSTKHTRAGPNLSDTGNCATTSRPRKRTSSTTQAAIRSSTWTRYHASANTSPHYPSRRDVRLRDLAGFA